MAFVLVLQILNLYALQITLHIQYTCVMPDESYCLVVSKQSDICVLIVFGVVFGFNL